MLTERNILEKIKNIVHSKDPSAQIYLYGSRAKGKAQKDSDWDLLILLNKGTVTLDDERDITYPLYDLEFDIGEIISPMVYAKEEWFSKYSITPFYHNVMKEGKQI